MLLNLIRYTLLLTLVVISGDHLQADQSSYKLELTSATGQTRVQARAGQITLIAAVAPKLQKPHRLQINSETMALNLDAKPGPVTIKGVPRGQQTFQMVIIDQESRLPVQKSEPLILDIRRYIPR